MYVNINKIIGEKTIDLSCPINNHESLKEIAIVDVFSDNVQYEITTPLLFELKVGEVKTKKAIPSGTYTSRELSSFISGNTKLTPLDKDPRVVKTNKLANVFKLNFALAELDNNYNLDDGVLSNVLLSYHVTDYGGVTNFEPKNPTYKKMKTGSFNSLTLRITDQNENLLTDSLGFTIVLHIR